jgi:hypothetical protein
MLDQKSCNNVHHASLFLFEYSNEGIKENVKSLYKSINKTLSYDMRDIQEIVKQSL